MFHKTFFWFFSTTKNVKTGFSLWAIQKQMVSCLSAGSWFRELQVAVMQFERRQKASENDVVLKEGKMSN